MQITTVPCTTLKPKPSDESKLGFGKIFTDYMFVMEHDETGWHDARIVPYAPFPMDPACAVLHYAQEVFEGMKAYRCADGTIRMFRPECNAERFIDGCTRMGIPPVPKEMFLEAVYALVEKEKAWVPHSEGTSLYVRPFAFCSDVGLGVHGSEKYIFCVIVSPSGSYYANGMKPVRIWVEDEYIRAAPGLTGAVKCGGNYAASLRSAIDAGKLGYDQVLWLDGVEHRYVEEVGAMNIFFDIDGKLYTAPLVGTVLPGVTRRSVIELAKEKGIEVIEGRLDVHEVMKAGKEGRLKEVFGTGTAAVISPVGLLHYEGETVTVHDGTIGPVAQSFYDELTDIQWGRKEDTRGWSKILCTD